MDVIILARGAVPIEDLWAFNDEGVVRAIVACPIPVVTGIGHETDFTLADFAADMRAPTPTAAAVSVVPDINDVRANLRVMQAELSQIILDGIVSRKTELRETMHSIARYSPIIRVQNERQHVDTLQEKGLRAMQHTLQLQRSLLQGNMQHLASVSPQAVLERGYAIVMSSEGRLVKSITLLKPEDMVDVKLRDGSFSTKIQKIHPANPVK